MPAADPVPHLTPTEIQALVVLMAEARELDNNELKELGGFALTGASNRKLEKLGLVSTDRDHRPYSHALTAAGWRLMERLADSPPPPKGGSAARSLFTLLGSVGRALDRLQVSRQEFFKQAPAPDVESRIRAAYLAVAGQPGEWVGLADLRDALPGLDRSAVDDALRRLARQPGVRVIPVANTKALTARDRAAAVRIGEEDNHTIQIGAA